MMLREKSLRPCPTLFFANKQDLPAALSAVETAQALGLADIRDRCVCARARAHAVVGMSAGRRLFSLLAAGAARRPWQPPACCGRRRPAGRDRVDIVDIVSKSGRLHACMWSDRSL